MAADGSSTHITIAYGRSRIGASTGAVLDKALVANDPEEKQLTGLRHVRNWTQPQIFVDE